MEIKIGTRASPLALAQTKIIADEISRSWPEIKITFVTIKTTGDKDLSPFKFTGNNKGIFTRELEQALLSHEIDFAVHSLKDLPANVNPDLPVVAFSKRATPFDALVGGGNIIGSSSLRRRLQLEKLYPEEKILAVRGNINTRLSKLDRGEFTGLVLAVAGLERLGLQDRITKIFTPDEILPAPGQGILACQGRANENYYYLDCVNDENSKFCAIAERSFARALNAGCNVPVGAYAIVEDDELILLGLYIDEKSKKFYRGTHAGNKHDAEIIGITLARRIFS